MEPPHLQALQELREHVLSSFKLGPKQLELMTALNVWTKVCTRVGRTY
jgi:hypothetical protein